MDGLAAGGTATASQVVGVGVSWAPLRQLLSGCRLAFFGANEFSLDCA
jgi:hypothetical protein